MRAQRRHAFAKATLGDYLLSKQQFERAGLWYIRAARASEDDHINHALAFLHRLNCTDLLQDTGKTDQDLAKTFAERYKKHKADG